MEKWNLLFFLLLQCCHKTYYCSKCTFQLCQFTRKVILTSLFLSDYTGLDVHVSSKSSHSTLLLIVLEFGGGASGDHRLTRAEPSWFGEILSELSPLLAQYAALRSHSGTKAGLHQTLKMLAAWSWEFPTSEFGYYKNKCLLFTGHPVSAVLL